MPREQWVAGVLADAGWRRTGPFEPVRERPWSLVAKVPTSAGVLWLKENRAGTVYEAALIELLPRWVPGRVLEPIAVDADRGWSLLPDGGPTVREAHEQPSPRVWEELLAQHAQLQRDLAGHSDTMLAAGVPDMRPKQLPGLLDGLSLPPKVAACAPTVHDLCAELADSPVPASLQHDDLHDANVFAGGRCFDWGDAAVAHPFGVLLVSLRVAGQFFDRPVLDRLRDAYLEPWSDLAPRARLLRDVAAAVQVAKVGRALSWQRALRDATPQQAAEWEDPVTAWLEELLV